MNSFVYDPHLRDSKFLLAGLDLEKGTFFAMFIR